MSKARRAERGMDVFRVRDRLIDDYREFTGSFVDIHDKNIRDHVADRMARGYQWPDPWLSLNPNFASGGTITDLLAEGLLQPECERIFRLKDGTPAGPVLRRHRNVELPAWLPGLDSGRIGGVGELQDGERADWLPMRPGRERQDLQSDV